MRCPPPPAAHAQWVSTLPPEAQAGILWVGDHEEGSLDDWDFPSPELAGGGIFNTGPTDEAIARASSVVAHSGAFCAEATIHYAIRSQNGNRAVRLMRWTDRPWNDGGDFFPPEAYFSTWIYFPEVYNPNKYPPWDPGDGGWWNLFQFKSDDDDGESQPIWALNLFHDDARGWMVFYLYSSYNPPHSFSPPVEVPIPVGRWVHLEAFYKQSSGQDGRITLWQDGRQILDVDQVQTILSGPAVWGIGNYTDHIAGGPVEGSATLYFDDGAVATGALSPHLAEVFRDGFETGDLRLWAVSPVF